MASLDVFYIISEDKFNMLQKCKTDTEHHDNAESNHNVETKEPGKSDNDNHHSSTPSSQHMDASTTHHDTELSTNGNVSSDGSDSEQSEEESSRQPMSVEHILARVSGKIRPRARLILHLVKNSLQWNDKGEIITQSGDVIHGSDISIIVRNISQPYKNRHIIGGHYVNNLMKRMNIPIHSVYNNKKVLSSGNVKKVKKGLNVKQAKSTDKNVVKKPVKWLKF